jgi:hypothetical protein
MVMVVCSLARSGTRLGRDHERQLEGFLHHNRVRRVECRG